MQKILRLTHAPAMAVVLVTLVVAAAGCPRHAPRTKSIFVIIESGGAGTERSQAVASAVNTLLAALVPGDTLLVGRTDADHLDQPDIIVKTTFNQRPSVISAQKRIVRQQILHKAAAQAAARQPDGIAALLLAAQYLHQTPSHEKFILIFSDLGHAPADGPAVHVPLHMQGIRIIALDASGPMNPDAEGEMIRQRMTRLQIRIESSGGIWQVISDHDQLGRILTAAGQPS